MSIYSAIKALLGTRIRLFGAGIAWDDLRVPTTSARDAGVRPPNFAQFRDDGSGSNGVYGSEFIDGAERELFFEAQTPHARKTGTDLDLHAHFSTKDTVVDGQTVQFFAEYTAAALFDVFPTTTIATSDFTWDTANPAHVPYAHLLHDIADIDGSGLGISSMILVRAGRDGSSDTFGGHVFIFEWDFHIQIDSFGSEAEYAKNV